MKRVRILYDVAGWAYYNDAVALKKYAPKDWVVDIADQNYRDCEKYDLILQFAYCYLDNLKQYLLKKDWFVPVVTSYNVGVGYNPMCVLKKVVKNSEGVVINNFGMYNAFGKNSKTICIPNGINTEIFNVKNPISERTIHRVVWIGSEFHKHIKGYEQYALPLKEKLEADGIDCDFRLVSSTDPSKRMTRPQLAEWYNKSTVYVVTSLNEGTPNPALESSACGCTVVATPVGNMPELIINGYNGYLVDWDVDKMYEAVKKAITNYQFLAANMQTIIKQWDWKDRSQWYFNFFDKILDKYQKRRLYRKISDSNPSPEIENTKQHFEILAYCSKNYIDAYNFTINSWTKLDTCDKVHLYTDWQFTPDNPKVEVTKFFTNCNCNWVTGCARRLDVIKDFSEKYKNSGKNIIFMDMDCYMKSDVSEVFDRDFDIAITRLYSKEKYTEGTASDSMWFAKMTPGYTEFIDAWVKLADEMKYKQDTASRTILYTQYAFNKVARQKIMLSPTCDVLALDEHIYNSEHSDLKKWFHDIVTYHPKILHFKNGRFNDKKLIDFVFRLYGNPPSNSQTTPPIRRPLPVNNFLWQRKI